MDTNTSFDTVAGVGAVTAPWWLSTFNSAMQEILLVGGVVLLVLRIAIAVRDFKSKRNISGGNNAE